ncbi:glycoside hydrolase family 64 protein [Cercospora zeae-maydis SCOH1-5]|uniref:Glycoside hydrolase family 64 protein n=1 Tax=Cercospora zeae-maydis SCOH1-5 TaxID=717836 RepID=A0A6A6F1A8_9PEZI|nr:glycoside hydrolase family 64 protein [Cercospora zeae-maydis SCOH1-5]
MHNFLSLPLLSLLPWTHLTSAVPLLVRDETSTGNETSTPKVLVRDYNTLNASTLPADADEQSKAAANGVLTLSIQNKWPSENLRVYVSGLGDNRALVMLGQDGKWIHPTTSSATPEPVKGPIAIPLGKPNSTLTLTLPGYLESSRVWIVDGTLDFFVVATPNGPGLVEPAAVNADDPNSQKNYAFAELSWGATYGLYADITAVDFVGLPLGIELEEANNAKHSILGTPSNAADHLCDVLKQQAQTDKQPWDQLCAHDSNGKLVRVLAPSNLISQKADAFKGYYDRYVNNAWTKFASEDLFIETQTDAGRVPCRVRDNQLQCKGDNRAYAKPTTSDIMGCNTGPFAIQAGDNGVHLAVVPRLCAAFHRSTLFLKGGNVQPGQPPQEYYRTPKSGPNSNMPPKNFYSKFVHDIEHESRGYAFAYDDVTAKQEWDQSGLVSSTQPKVLRIIVGGT